MPLSHVTPSPDAMYTPAVAADGLVFTAGQVGEDPATGAVPDDFGAEVDLALDNLEQVLGDAGSGLGYLVSATCYISDIALAPTFNERYARRIPQPRPARATVQVAMMPPYRIEIVCIAAVGG